MNIERFREKLTKCNPHAAWLSSFKPSVSEKDREEDDVNTLPSLHNIDYQLSDNVDLKATDTVRTFIDYFCTLSITPDECQTIKESTKGQHNNKLWREAKKGRITSSSFGPVCKRLPNTAPDNLLKTILYPVSFENEATRWGIQHESAARRQYINRLRKTHESIHVEQSGLVVNYMYPHFGSSPDGFVYCKDFEEPEGLLEVKCPYKYRFQTPEEAAQHSDFCCTIVNDKLKLKETHHYYYQIQGQMAICTRPWCDFVIWTCKGMDIQRIEFDYKFWENTMLRPLTKFYIGSVIPELFSSRVFRGKPLFPNT